MRLHKMQQAAAIAIAAWVLTACGSTAAPSVTPIKTVEVAKLPPVSAELLTAHPKPAADIYLLAASRLGVAPEACVALEDSELGVRAAAAAGMDVIQVPDLVPASALSRSLARVAASLHEAHAVLNSKLS